MTSDPCGLPQINHSACSHAKKLEAPVKLRNDKFRTTAIHALRY